MSLNFTDSCFHQYLYELQAKLSVHYSVFLITVINLQLLMVRVIASSWENHRLDSRSAPLHSSVNTIGWRIRVKLSALTYNRWYWISLSWKHLTTPEWRSCVCACQCVCVCTAHPYSNARSGDEGDDWGSDSLWSRRRGSSRRYGASAGIWGCTFMSNEFTWLFVYCSW